MFFRFVLCSLLFYYIIIITSVSGICNPSPCPAGTNCTTTASGFEYCKCTNPLQYLDPSGTKCINYHCGADRNDVDNRCNGPSNGICVGGDTIDYCMCNEGYTGKYCEIENIPDYSICDCGIRWDNNAGEPVTRTVIASKYRGLILIQDYPNVNLFGPTGILPVGHKEQAQHRCSLDVVCLGFLYDEINKRAYFYTNLTTTTISNDYSVPLTIPNIQFMLYKIDRHSLNLCDGGLTFNYNHYFIQQQYFGLVNQYCTETRESLLLNLRLATPTCTNTQYWAERHWRYAGHKLRLSPNSNCILSPVVFNDKTYCRHSHCLSIVSETAIPCSANGFLRGYCLPDNPGSPIPNSIRNKYSLSETYSGFKCKCKTFNNIENGTPGLLGTPFWMGYACELSVLSNCVDNVQGDKVICGGHPSSCQAEKVWSGEFYLDNFGSNAKELNSTYVPKCNCNGLDVMGQYCKDSRCGLSSGHCNSLYAGAGQCLLNTGNNQWECHCQQNAIGQYCEINAISCVYPNTGFKCSGSHAGVCNAANPSLNKTNPYCNCLDGYTGQWCEKTHCTSDIMEPGHGICLDGEIDHCFKPYTGTRCEYDNCYYSGGFAIPIAPSSNIPEICECPAPLQLQYSQTGVPSCWPQCPIVDGIVCGKPDLIASGGLYHLCKQIESTTTHQRFANCECAPGHILEFHELSGSMVCVPFCKHGVPHIDWTPTNNLLPCLCDRSTGYDINHGLNPRCDHFICRNGGIFNNQTYLCECKPPWTSESDCEYHTCNGVGSQVINWYNLDTGNIRLDYPFKCDCKSPLTSSNPLLLPFDCNSNLCLPFGIINPTYNPASKPLKQQCQCLGLAKTLCHINNITQQEHCSFCQSSFCLNGGYITIDNPSKCICYPPYAGTLCDIIGCHSNNTELIDYINQQCVCKQGFFGIYCTENESSVIITTSSSSTGLIGPPLIEEDKEEEEILTLTKTNFIIVTTVVGSVVTLSSIGAGIYYYYYYKASYALLAPK